MSKRRTEKTSSMIKKLEKLEARMKHVEEGLGAVAQSVIVAENKAAGCARALIESGASTTERIQFHFTESMQQKNFVPDSAYNLWGQLVTCGVVTQDKPQPRSKEPPTTPVHAERFPPEEPPLLHDDFRRMMWCHAPSEIKEKCPHFKPEEQPRYQCSDNSSYCSHRESYSRGCKPK